MQRDNLSAKARQLGEDLTALREGPAAARELDVQEARIRECWRELTASFRRQVRSTLDQFPLPEEARTFNGLLAG